MVAECETDEIDGSYMMHCSGQGTIGGLYEVLGLSMNEEYALMAVNGKAKDRLVGAGVPYLISGPRSNICALTEELGEAWR